MGGSSPISHRDESEEEEEEPSRTTPPPGIRFIERVRKSPIPFRTHQAIVLILTFLVYASYHAARKTTSVVKGVLDPQSNPSSSSSSNNPAGGFLSSLRLYDNPQPPPPPPTLTANINGATGWAPFDGPGGTALLGQMDVAFLAVYSLGMYFSGHLGDRLDLRRFLAVGMLGTGLFTAVFGAGYWMGVHSYAYFLGAQMLAGLFQSTGWPSVVSVVGNWFGKSGRGLIMGVWNAHTSVGNISGSLIAAAMLKYGWGWSFAVPGLLIAILGVVVFLFLPVRPEGVVVDGDEDVTGNAAADVNAAVAADVDRLLSAVAAADDDDDDDPAASSHNKEYCCSQHAEPLLAASRSTTKDNKKQKPVGFIEAWRIPGVAPFAFCLFFCKLVAYTFLYWLPFYISHTAIDGKYLSDSAAGTLSTLFDVGGVLGGILAGHISDRLDARAIVAATFTYLSIPSLYLYRAYGSRSIASNVTLMFLSGLFVNGPYALITTAVSADLGTHGSLGGNSRALATVTAIIDGTGSVGAAIGPLLTGYISAGGWDGVFVMLMVAALVAGLLLSKLVIAEVSAKRETAAAAAMQPAAAYYSVPRHPDSVV